MPKSLISGWWMYLVLAACRASVQRQPPALSSTQPVLSQTEDHEDSVNRSAAPCAGSDAIVPRNSERLADVDLDGIAPMELVFRDGQSMHGNSEFYFVRLHGTCAEQLGHVTSFVVNTPHCVKPPTAGDLCQLSAMPRMFHDDYQETIFAFSGGTLVEVGVGRYIEPRRGRKP
jgi:hypothetical protein